MLTCVKDGENGIYSEGIYPTTVISYLFGLVKCFHIKNGVAKYVVISDVKKMLLMKNKSTQPAILNVSHCLAIGNLNRSLPESLFTCETP